jgi:DNA-binding Lrp family transcriptional regulator
MADEPLNNLDRRILHLLQVDARDTNRDIAEETDVTSTTVATRIERLEDRGIIQGYYPDIDYEAAGYPLVILLVSTVPVAKRATLAKQALDVVGVVNVKQILSGEQNLYVQAVAESTDRIERITEELDDLGLRIHRSDIVSQDKTQPWNHFHLKESADDVSLAADDRAEE